MKYTNFVVKIFIMAQHNDLGRWGEDIAAEYLESKGYVILERDWKIGHRDIDIIALDGDEMAFVEVKTRRSNLFQQPEQAVDWVKVRNLTYAANAYVKQKMVDNVIRFDVVTVLASTDDDYKVDHIENAFMPLMTRR